MSGMDLPNPPFAMAPTALSPEAPEAFLPHHRSPLVANGTVDERLLWILHRAIDEWGARSVARVACELAGLPDPTQPPRDSP